MRYLHPPPSSTNPLEPITPIVDASLPLLPRTQASKDSSILWKNFTQLTSDDPKYPKSYCNYYKKQYNFHGKRNWTSGMLFHMDFYKKWHFPCDEKQKTVSFQAKKKGDNGVNELMVTSYSE